MDVMSKVSHLGKAVIVSELRRKGMQKHIQAFRKNVRATYHLTVKELNELLKKD